MTALESRFQARLIKDLKQLFPGCVVLKNDPGYVQGIPDLLVLYKQHWAMLECKLSRTGRRQPNQEYYVNLLDEMSFAAFISEDNKNEVLDDLQYAFGLGRPTRVSQRQRS